MNTGNISGNWYKGYKPGVKRLWNGFLLSVMMLKSLKLSLTITLILFICYFTKEAHDGNIKGSLDLSQWMPPVELVEEKSSKLHTQQVPPEDLLPCIAYFHLHLLPF